MRKGRSTTGGGLPYHISYGDLFAGSADVAVRFRALHAQGDASAHNDSVAGNCAPGRSSRAWIQPTIAAVSIKPSARSATPLNWGLSAVLNCCLMHRDLHRSPNFPPQNSPLPSDRTVTTCDGTPSARVSERNCLNVSAASDFVAHKVHPRIP